MVPQAAVVVAGPVGDEAMMRQKLKCRTICGTKHIVRTHKSHRPSRLSVLCGSDGQSPILKASIEDRLFRLDPGGRSSDLLSVVFTAQSCIRDDSSLLTMCAALLATYTPNNCPGCCSISCSSERPQGALADLFLPCLFFAIQHHSVESLRQGLTAGVRAGAICAGLDSGLRKL